MSDKVLHRDCFVFNKKDNGGESLSLTTSWIDNGDDIGPECDGIYLNQELSLQSYSNSASFNLCGAIITPSILRDLANKLEQGYNKALNIKHIKEKSLIGT